jgi:diacylglycerol kinase (ATP)
MRLTPGASPDDGVLDVVLIRSMSVPVRLWVFPRVYRGMHARLRQVSSHRCHRLTIDADVRVLLEADGELLGFPPCEIDLLPAALRVRGTDLPARSSTDGTN